MSRPSLGGRLKLLKFDQKLIERIHDFREAALDANESALLERAVSKYMDDYLNENAGVRREYLAIRKRKNRKD